MEITLNDRQNKLALNPPQILKVIKKILKFQGIDQAELSIVFVSRQKITALNRKFLRRSHGTDVLAFDLSEPASKSKLKRRSIMGDIIISTNAIHGNAKAFDTTASRELALYVVHGILHLCGYDDHKAADIKKMRNKEQELLDHLGASVMKCLR